MGVVSIVILTIRMAGIFAYLAQRHNQSRVKRQALGQLIINRKPD